MGFPDSTVVKNPSANAGDVSDARSGRSPGVGNGNPIPWTEEPDCLESMGLQRVGHDWACINTIYGTY